MVQVRLEKWNKNIEYNFYIGFIFDFKLLFRVSLKIFQIQMKLTNFPIFKEKKFISYKKLANFICTIFKFFFNLLENEISRSIWFSSIIDFEPWNFSALICIINHCIYIWLKKFVKISWYKLSFTSESLHQESHPK